MTARLRAGAALPPEVALPGYDPETRGVGVVHLGIGAFHRAHQAAYLDDCMAIAPGNWRVRGLSLRSPGVREQLAPQDGRYLLVEQDAAGDRLRLMGAVADVLVVPEDPARAVTALADPHVKLVSLTVTEKGYCHDPATGGLDVDHPDIAHDLAHPDRPRSAPGLVVAGLAARFAMGLAPPTLVCCDNLPDNGRVLAGVLSAYAALRSDRLSAWIEREVAAPSTMVDRIVPATTADDLARLRDRTGVEDRGAVKTEPFRQWVIADRWSGARPPLERVGAQLVGDVRPFELAKLRMLNGAHSLLAYLGLRLGHTYVHQAIADPALARLVRGLMLDEAAPTLPAAPGLDVARYADALLARFANPALHHRLLQIAMDGSQKLPQRLLGTVRDAYAREVEPAAALLAVAAWMLHATGRGPDGMRHAVDDPLAPTLAAATARGGGEPEALVRAMLGVDAVFGDLHRHEPAISALVAHVRGLLDDPAAHVQRTAAGRLEVA